MHHPAILASLTYHLLLVVMQGLSAPVLGQEMSPQFQRFKFSYFGPGEPREGLDVTALMQLQGAERTRAEDLLLAALPEARAITGLGQLRSQRAKPRLREIFEAERAMRWKRPMYPDGDWKPYELVRSAGALWLIGPDQRWLSALTDILTTAKHDYFRLIALEEIFNCRDKAAVAPLVDALGDTDALVRHHAAQALLAFHGLPYDSVDTEAAIYRVMAQPGSPRHAAGRDDILAAFAGKPIVKE